MIAYPFKGCGTCPRVRGNEDGLRRHVVGSDGSDRRREGSTDISRFAGLRVDVKCCDAGGVPTVVVKK